MIAGADDLVAVARQIHLRMQGPAAPFEGALPDGSGIASRAPGDLVKLGENFVAIDQLHAAVAELADAAVELGRPRASHP